MEQTHGPPEVTDAGKVAESSTTDSPDNVTENMEAPILQEVTTAVPDGSEAAACTASTITLPSNNASGMPQTDPVAVDIPEGVEDASASASVSPRMTNSGLLADQNSSLDPFIVNNAIAHYEMAASSTSVPAPTNSAAPTATTTINVDESTPASTPPAPKPPAPLEAIAENLKCPACLELYTDPVLLDCSHSLCLLCAEAIVSLSEASSTADFQCPLCHEVTAVAGAEEAHKMEDALVSSALRRSDVHTETRSIQIQDLQICCDRRGVRVGIVPDDIPGSTALRLYRLIVAKMESQELATLGQKLVLPTRQMTDSGGVEDSMQVQDGEAVTMTVDVEHAIHKWQFQRNALLDNLVTHFKIEHQNNGAALSQTDPIEKLSRVLIKATHLSAEDPSHSQLPNGQVGSELDAPHSATESNQSVGAEQEGIASDPTLQDLSPADDAGSSPSAAVRERGRGDASRHIWVGNLGGNTNEGQLREGFAKFGELESVRFLRKGINSTAFLHYKHTEDAERAKEHMTGDFLPGQSNATGALPLRVQYQTRATEPSSGLRVHNLSPAATEEEVREIFGKHGRLKAVSLNLRSHIAFIHYDTKDQAMAAFHSLHDSVLRDRHAFVDYSPASERDVRTRERGPERSSRPSPERRSRGPPAGARGSRDSRDRPSDRGGRGIHPRFERGRNDRGPRDSRKIQLTAPRGYPPFECFPDEVHKLREMVSVMQARQPVAMRQTLEDALQNEELYSHISSLLRTNRRDLNAVIRDFRREVDNQPPMRNGPPVAGYPGGPHEAGPYGPPYAQRGPPPTSVPSYDAPRGTYPPSSAPPARKEVLDPHLPPPLPAAYDRPPPFEQDRRGRPRGSTGNDSAAYGGGFEGDAYANEPRGGRGGSRLRRSRSPPRSGRGGGRGRRGRDGPGPRSRSRSPPSKRRREDALEMNHAGFLPQPTPLPPVVPLPAPAGMGRMAKPLEAECEQFMQTVVGRPPIPAVPALPPVALSGRMPYQGGHRIWLDSTAAATYPCYEGVLELIKTLLNPYYRSNAITKETFKRIAEDSTLLLVQQMLESRLENRPDVPAHLQSSATDMIRGMVG